MEVGVYPYLAFFPEKNFEYLHTYYQYEVLACIDVLHAPDNCPETPRQSRIYCSCPFSCMEKAIYLESSERSCLKLEKR